MRKRRSVIVLSLTCAALIAAAVAVGGCGKKTDAVVDPTEGRPESVTAYEAVQFTRPSANKWQSNNWMIQVRSGDPDGLSRDGKSRIWEVYYFSPTPEQDCQMFVIYNRGNVWPNSPGVCKGGEQGQETYRKEKPNQDFRVDSPEAYTVAFRNGGGDYLNAHEGARAEAVLRCKADYDAIGEKMPAPKYKWIWDVSYKVPTVGAEVLHVMVDGMNGDFITKQTAQPPS